MELLKEKIKYNAMEIEIIEVSSEVKDDIRYLMNTYKEGMTKKERQSAGRLLTSVFKAGVSKITCGSEITVDPVAKDIEIMTSRLGPYASDLFIAILALGQLLPIQKKRSSKKPRTSTRSTTKKAKKAKRT